MSQDLPHRGRGSVVLLLPWGGACVGFGLELTRRSLLRAGLASAGAFIVPLDIDFVPIASLPAVQVDPHAGVVPMTFPLHKGEFGWISDNWHQPRAGKVWPSNHRGSATRRAHDGNDIFPARRGNLPLVSAPFGGVVLAVCIFRRTGADYVVSSLEAPRQDYSNVVDGRTPRHGHHVWLKSTALDASAGYHVVYSHLQDEATIESLLQKLRGANQLSQYLVVSASTPVGRLGDTGNAVGSPQLHLELHLPGTSTFGCSRCHPGKGGMTSINPRPSLIAAARSL